VTDPENFPRATRLSSRDLIRAKMVYMIGIMEEMVSWGKEDIDESRLNKTSIASAAFKILLFEAEVRQVGARITKYEFRQNGSSLVGIMDLPFR
jgi:hypothetical protein